MKDKIKCIAAFIAKLFRAVMHVFIESDENCDSCEQLENDADKE